MPIPWPTPRSLPRRRTSGWWSWVERWSRISTRSEHLSRRNTPSPALPTRGRNHAAIESWHAPATGIDGRVLGQPAAGHATVEEARSAHQEPGPHSAAALLWSPGRAGMLRARGWPGSEPERALTEFCLQTKMILALSRSAVTTLGGSHG